jgi:hypothetical protein
MSSKEDSGMSPIEKSKCEGVCFSLLEEDHCFKDLDFPLQHALQCTKVLGYL